MPIAALILAAGAGTRWRGACKPLVKLGGETLLARATRTALAAGCAPILRVLGAQAELIAASCPAPPGVLTTVHAGWSEGMGGSLAAGMRALLAQAPATTAVYILLCDQPLVSPALLQRMASSLVSLSSLTATVVSVGTGAAAGAASPRPDGDVGAVWDLIYCDHGGGVLGPPALIGCAHFPALAALTGHMGARVLARAHPARVGVVSAPEAAWDLDAPEDLERLLAAFPLLADEDFSHLRR